MKKALTDKFLDRVAAWLANRVTDEPGRWWVVFPNKRAGIYLRGYLRRYLDGPTLMPRLMTVGAFESAMLATDDSVEIDRIEQLFVLYQSYCRVCAKRQTEPMVFDRFAFWGSMIVDDFNDLDANLADASKLYKNIKDINETSSYYLTPDQIEAIAEIWGDKVRYNFTPPDENTFWKHIEHLDETAAQTGETGSEESISKRFVRLWEIMGLLYKEYQQNLDDRNLLTPGKAARKVAAVVRNTAAEEMPMDHVVFVGFSHLDKAHTLVMRDLRRKGLAQFFWDTLPDRPWTGGHGDEVAAYARALPMPDDFNAPEFADPHVQILAVPSNYMQAKVIGNRLHEWAEANIVRERYADNTLVALSDQSLLIPLLGSIPQSIDPVNITMGMSLRGTPLATLLRSVTSMQMRSRMLHGEPTLFHEDVTNLISHPLLKALVPDVCAAIQLHMSIKRRYNVPVAELKALCKGNVIACIFDTEGSEPWTPAQVVTYIHNLADALRNAMESKVTDGQHINTNAHEMLVLAAYVEAADRIARYIDAYRTGYVGRGALFQLFERIIAQQTINMSGSPVRGLQVMGMLETRALDFDNIIIPSMNERIYPRRSRMRTLIPQNLRRGYGLTAFDDADNEYAYYFFRLLSRARRVVCLYNSAMTGTGRGAPSRYLQQLVYLADGNDPERRALTLQANPTTPMPIVVPKDSEVMERLQAFRNNDPEKGPTLNLSASALKTYRKCGLEFYIKHVLNVDDENEPVGYMDAATYGNVVHGVLQDLFNSLVTADGGHDDKGQALVTEKAIDSLIDPERILRRVARKINEIYFNRPERGDDMFAMPGESKLLAGQMRDYIVRVLEKERDQIQANGPFIFKDAEERIATTGRHGDGRQWHVADGLDVNFNLSIDRHDVLAGPNHLFANANDVQSGDIQRFIDYKTGSDKPTVTNVANLFSRKQRDSNDAILQLLTYCEAYADFTGEQLTIEPALYRLVKAFATNEKDHPFEDDAIYINKEKVVWTNIPGKQQAAWQPEFRQRLNEMVASIFDPAKPFDQTDDIETCGICPFWEICGRITKSE